MAQPRPLSLRSEKYNARQKLMAPSRAIASVWVDASVFHVDMPLDYLVDVSLDDDVQVGVRVIVPFNTREVEGLVIDRRDGEATRHLKWISKVLSPIPVATEVSIELIKKTALHWAAHPFDLLRSAIPPRVAAVDKEQWHFSEISSRKLKRSSTYLQLPPCVDPYQLIHEYCAKNRTAGSRLIVMPDSRSVSALRAYIPDAVILDSESTKEERYRNFLSSLYGSGQIVMGTRSAIFAPIRDLSEIIIFDESSELHYELRSPGWNTRDVALLRSTSEELSLTFIGYGPSAEVAAKIERGEIKYRSGRNVVKVLAQQPEHGELIPSRIFALVRSALKSGSVLCIAPRKGYAQAISCSQCRNMAICQCGGKLIQESAQSSLRCSICNESHVNWRCSWCHSNVPYLLSRGSERFSYELGKAFPGVRIIESQAGSIKENVSDDHALVIATPGAIPRRVNGYKAIVLLNGELVFSSADIRGLERARHIVFSSATHLSQDGTYALVLSPRHPIIGALSSWKPSLLNKRELEERDLAGLPPFTRAITLEVNKNEGQQIVRALKGATLDGRLPAHTKIHGPLEAKKDLVRIVLFAPFDEGDSLVEMLHEFQRKRSASGKKLAQLRVDPYSIE